MIYPVLAYKEFGDLNLYGIKTERTLRYTSRELLKRGVFDGVLLIDSSGTLYKMKNARENGWANPFWGINIFRRGRGILIDFDLEYLEHKTLDDVKLFVLERLSCQRNSVLDGELRDEVMKSATISQIISVFV